MNARRVMAPRVEKWPAYMYRAGGDGGSRGGPCRTSDENEASLDRYSLIDGPSQGCRRTYRRTYVCKVYCRIELISS